MADVRRQFTRLLVPYDGSEPAAAALTLAAAIAAGGAAIVIATVVNETPVIAQTATAMVAYDPAPLLEALDAEAKALLDDAVARCAPGGRKPLTTIVHDTPVAGIIAAVTEQKCDLVIMGTHARTGVARTFLGSTTEGVLRASSVPVLTVRTINRAEPAPFATAVVAVDDSEPADAAAAVAAMLATAFGSCVIAVHALDTARVYDNAVAYGFDPEPLVGEMRAEGAEIVRRALARALLPAGTPVAIVEGRPAQTLVATAAERHATAIVVGTHGRRGLQRFVLGSVAEAIVRTSDVPVLVVPAGSPA